MVDDYNVVTEQCRKGDFKTLRADVNGRKIYIHSKYDPVSESEKQISSLALGVGANYIIVGLGMGYHIRALLKRLKKSDNNIILVIEPNRQIYELFINDENNKDILNDIRTEIVHYTSINKLNEYLNYLYSATSSYLNNYLFYLPVYKEIYSGICTEIAKNIKSLILSCFLAINTQILLSELWFKCTINSIRFLRKSYSGKKLTGLFKGIPAIIVSAGPSLSKNIDILGKLYDKAVIIAVDTAAKPLYTKGIKSHFFVTIDAQPRVMAKFSETDALEGDLIACFTSALQVLSNHTGRKIAFTAENVFFDQCFDELGVELIKLESGGSVACSALDIAHKTGADPIIFVGQDLAYTGYKSHVEGTPFYRQGNNLKNADIIVSDLEGNKIPTTYNLNQYREWMEMYIHLFPDRTYIDATEGGAKIEGTDILTLSEAVERYCVNEHKIEEIKGELFTDDNMSFTFEQAKSLISIIEDSGKFLSKTLPEIRACISVCERLIKEIDSNGFKHPHKIVKLYKRVKKLNNTLDANEHYVDIVLPLMGLHREEAARTDHLRDETLTEEKVLALDLEKYKSYYKALAEKIVFATPLIEDATINNMEAINNE